MLNININFRKRNPRRLTKRSKAAVREALAYIKEYRGGYDYSSPLSKRHEIKGRPRFLLSIGPDDRRLALSACRRASPRKKNWRSPLATCRQVSDGEYQTDMIYRRHWLCKDYYPLVQAYAMIDDTETLLGAVIKQKHYALHAPRGYKWGYDETGAKLVRTRDNAEYYPNSDDIRAGVLAIRKKLIDTAAGRKEEWREKEEKENTTIRKIIKSPEKVTFEDHIKAGNCRAGTIVFYRELGLDVTIAYSFRELYAIISNKYTPESWAYARFMRVAKHVLDKELRAIRDKNEQRNT